MKVDSILVTLEKISSSKGFKKLLSLSKTNSNLLSKNVMLDIETLLRNTKGIPGIVGGNGLKFN